MEPTLGRIVIYRFGAADAKKFNRGAATAPAIICAVHADYSVGLRVLCDATAIPHIESARCGEGPGQWSWPQVAR
jgi:hypothetical protein